RTIKEWCQETPIEKYREVMGVPLPEVWETLLTNHTHVIREKANDYFQKRLIENISNGKGALYPHVEEVFTYLKEIDCSIFIASNGQKSYLHSIVGYYKLNNWIT